MKNRIGIGILLLFVLLLSVSYGQAQETTMETSVASDSFFAKDKIDQVTNAQPGDGYNLTVTKSYSIYNGTTLTDSDLNVDWVIGIKVVELPDASGDGRVEVNYYDPSGALNYSYINSFSWYQWANPYVYTDVNGWKQFLEGMSNTSTSTDVGGSYSTKITVEFKETQYAFGAVITQSEVEEITYGSTTTRYEWNMVQEFWYAKADGGAVKISMKTDGKTIVNDNVINYNSEMELIAKGFDLGESIDSTGISSPFGPLGLPEASFFFLSLAVMSTLIINKRRR